MVWHRAPCFASANPAPSRPVAASAALMAMFACCTCRVARYTAGELLQSRPAFVAGRRSAGPTRRLRSAASTSSWHSRRSATSSAATPGGDAGVQADVASLPVKELRRILDERGMRHVDCFEKQELVERAREALLRPLPQKPSEAQQASPTTARAAGPASFEGFGELVKIQPTSPAAAGPASLLFLHGLGDSATGFAGQLPRLLRLPEVRFVLPTAKADPRMGGVRSWFDLGGMARGGASMDPRKAMNEVQNAAMRSAIDYVHHLIRQELEQGVDPGRIIVGGFSQGGCLAVRAALEFPDAPLGGCIATSTFLGSTEQLPIAPANAKLQMLVCHGDADGVVPPSEGRRLADALRAKGLPAEFRAYPNLGHAYCDQEQTDDVSGFVRRRLLLAGLGEEGLKKLSARELKGLLVELGVSTSDCFDKLDLLDRARNNVL